MGEVTQDPAIQQAAGELAGDVPTLISDVKKGDVQGGLTAAASDYERLLPLAAPVYEEAKAGYKTTEFYLVIVYEALTQTGAIHLPGSWGKAAAGIAGILAYALSRGLAKSGTPNLKV